MFQIKDKIYCEAGYILEGNSKRGYQLIGNLSDFTERKLSLDNLEVHETTVTYDNIVQSYNGTKDYGELKAQMVKRRYSNDDQIAIILNKDNSPEDLERFNKMQEWREWSGLVAKKILEVINNE